MRWNEYRIRVLITSNIPPFLLLDTYVKTNGKCETVTKDGCQAFSTLHGYSLSDIRQSIRPPGCYLKPDDNNVWFNTYPSTVHCTYKRQCICKSTNPRKSKLQTFSKSTWQINGPSRLFLKRTRKKLTDENHLQSNLMTQIGLKACLVLTFYFP